MMIVAPLVAGIAAVALVGLSLAVSLRRMKVGTDIGAGDDVALLRRIRAQGNFIEYVPLCLILLALAEFQRASATMLWTISGLLIVGRLFHAIGIWNGITMLRALGMIATYASLLTAAAALLF